ncbi:hypothetical protein PRZ48_008737 [Zasmidium cellare]|uniref:Uncharacterized protein n=1 Tax=Zasmidium cellare TaxID=395010 RepID=A0ABR0EHE3_ZASCE|nr:hypothetical protein PRZ48_008737 [Zasmidium cellare]
MVEAFLSQDDLNGASSSSASVLPPEKEDSAFPQTVMPRDKFRPVKGADYTESFVSQLRDELRKVGEKSFRKVPLWAVCLEMPTRQRLIFRDEFITRRNTASLNFGNYCRAMQIYRVGAAQRVACDACQRGMGPFRRCVIDADGDALKDRKQTAGDQSSQPSNLDRSTTLHDEPPPTESKRKKQSADSPSPDGSLHQDPISPAKSSKRPRTSTTTHPSVANTPATATKKTKRPKVSKAPPDNHDGTPAITSNVVSPSTIFAAGQASAEQVQYILKHCDATQKAFFTGAWLSWCSERDALGRTQPFEGIEAFLSEGWHEDLNEVIPKVCPVES